MNTLARLSVYSLALSALAVASPLPLSADEKAPPTSLPSNLLEATPLGEELEVLRPASPRDEKRQDQLHAAGLFAHGRLLQNRGEYEGALQRFQRAWRYHPQQVSILDSILPLAFELKRNGVAARYAVIAAEQNPEDSTVLRRLAMYLAQQEKYQRASAMYEKAIDLAPPLETDSSRLAMQMELGRLYLVQEEYQSAAEAFLEPAKALEHPDKYDLTEEFQKALQGEAERTYLLFGESFVRAGMLDRAEQAFRQAHQAEPNEALLAYSLARVAAEKGQRKKALKRLGDYFESKQAVAGLEPYELYAELISKEVDRPQKARQQIIQRLTPLQEADPANAALSVFLAQQLTEHGQNEAAETIYQELLKVNPSLDAYNGLIKLHWKEQNTAKLLAALGQVAALVGDFEPLEESVAELFDDDKLLAELLEEAQRRRAADPDNMGEGVALAAGLLAIEAEVFEQVKPFMKLALAEGMPAKGVIVSQWGLELLIAEQSEAAAEVFQMAIDKKVDAENNAAYYYYLASALGMNKQLDQAVEAAEKASELRPIARFESRIPWLYYFAKRYDEAERGYQKILDQYGDQYDDSNTRDVVRDARLVLSTIALKQGDFDQSVEYLEQVLDEYPEDIGAKNDLGYLWADENVHLQRAHAMIVDAVAAEPDNLAYRDSLGWVLFRLGRVDEALVELEQTAAVEEPDGVILDHLAEALWAAGKHQRAKEVWQRAIAAFEKSEEPDSVKEVRQKLDRNP